MPPVRFAFSAMTYNIHSGLGRDGRRDLARIARIIRDSGCHLAALQEVDSRPGPHTASEQMTMLSEMTGMQAIPGHTILQEERSYGNVLLTRLPYTLGQAVDLSCRGREPRGAIDLCVHTPAGDLRVIATHLGLGLRERLLQARALAGAIGRESAPLLLLGDFNEWLPGRGALAPLYRQMPPPHRIATYPARLPLLALDRVWTRPRSLLRRLACLREWDAPQASDHLPLVGHLELTGVPSLPQLQRREPGAIPI